MSASQKNLWAHVDFIKLWAGQSVSMFGSLLTRFALPFTVDSDYDFEGPISADWYFK
jgi:hypothetical protein